MDFVAIDVETANPDFASICQVGVARFQGGQLMDTWETLVDPEDDFDGVNVSIHGIDEKAVRSAPLWPAAFSRCAPLLEGSLVVSHTSFDRAALARACEKHQIPLPAWRWLDTARVVRRAWPQFAKAGYGLANIAAHLGIPFQHHNAREDARTAGEILLRAILETGLRPEDWIHRVRQPIDPNRTRIATEANPAGPLCGEV